ncbi:hypothetical protein [Actinomadura montaniterrae]|uniref:Uncharacterized protein n=1 Tax=Actinomadura montaniterrae TaxID=1803903 RepID=A0A6L3W2Y8_9ACTN|nr:hypothetical protein [Actinomadura montaniterrae]KAB2385953.1 hypothetical protein F9B16_09150 [Actinomadura montaniterrae]
MYTASATAVTVVRNETKTYKRSCRHAHLTEARAERCARHLEDELRELAGDHADRLTITRTVSRTGAQ